MVIWNNSVFLEHHFTLYLGTNTISKLYFYFIDKKGSH